MPEHARRPPVAPLLIAALCACGAARADLYVCTVKGRTITSDRPPLECADQRVRELNPDGSLKRVIEPPLTPEERRKRDADEKARRDAEDQARARQQKDRALLETYASETEIESARTRTLAARQVLVDRATQRLAQYARDKRKLDNEAEFYAKREQPDKLKRAFENNRVLREQQERAISDARTEMQHIDERYGAELKRFRELLQQGATPVQRPVEPSADAPTARTATP